MATSTLIAAETRVDGRIEGSRDVTVAGVVDGEIQLSEALVVAEGGFVRGEIEVDRLTIEGAVEGTIRAEGTVVLRETAQVAADVHAAGLVLEEGARLSGEIDVEGTEAPSGRTRSVSSSSSRRSTSSSSSSTSSSTSSGTSGRDRSTSAATSPSSSTSTTTTTRTETTSETAETDESSEEESSEETEASEEASEASGDSEPDLSSMNEDEIADHFTVRELRDELRDRDLTVRGKKAELIERLMENV